MKLDVDVNGVVTGFNRESIVPYHLLIHIIISSLPPIPVVVATEQAQKAKFFPFRASSPVVLQHLLGHRRSLQFPRVEPLFRSPLQSALPKLPTPRALVQIRLYDLGSHRRAPSRGRHPYPDNHGNDRHFGDACLRRGDHFQAQILAFHRAVGVSCATTCSFSFGKHIPGVGNPLNGRRFLTNQRREADETPM